MVKEPIRRANKDGVEVLISSDTKTFDVTINVSPEATRTHKIKCKDFIFKFQVLNGEESLNMPLHFETKDRRYRDSIINSGITLIYKKDGCYECKIYLRACLYAPDKIRKAIRQNQNRGKGSKGNLQGKYSTSDRINRQINYSYNNVNKPYQGGSCTPK